jgi:hypothetical protein
MMSLTSSLPRSTPEEQGVSSSSVVKFLEAIETNKLELHSFMLLRHGYVISEGWWAPYRADLKHMLFSLSKSFTSTAIGLAEHEGLLSLDDLLVSFFPGDLPDTIGENLSKLRIKDLLSMATGHAEDTTGKLHNDPNGNWVKAFLSIPIDYEPGTHFVYNSGATYMLSAIVQKVTGVTVLDYLTPRLFEPLEIEGATWETCPKGINTGGWGLNIKTEDIAKFGQLYLQKGLWNGVQLLTENWVDEATTFKISNGNDENNDWAQGYCYQFWKCRNGAYRGDGAFGQYCIVMPEQDSVIAIASGLGNMQAVLNVIWENLLPAMECEPLSVDAVLLKTLGNKLSSLALLPPKSTYGSDSSNKVSGVTYEVQENELAINTVKLLFEDNTCKFITSSGDNRYEVHCGIESWIEGQTSVLGFPTSIAASGTWVCDNSFQMTWRFIETPFYDTVICNLEDDKISIKISRNVSFGPTELSEILGQRINQ